MAYAPQVVHICNHTIEAYEKTAGTLCVLRGSGDIDELPSGLNVQTVYNVYQVIDQETFESRFYYKDTDFFLLGLKSIQWVPGRGPSSGSDYYVECYYIVPIISTYTQEDCPRCYGNGWYVDLMVSSQTNVNKLYGSNKIVQDFIKIIFTYQRDGDLYGTKITDYVGKVVPDTNQLCSEIASIIYSAGELYKDMQAKAILDGNDLQDNEILDSLIINSIDFDEESSGVYAEISLYSKTGTESLLGVGI